jgi:hypothetical protein
MMTIQPVKLIILENDGIFGHMLDGSIINAGGTSHDTWTVNGRGLLFDDGASTAPSGSSRLSLQRIYDLTNAVNGEAVIKLTLGKDFVLKDDTDDNLFFKVDAETGKVTITGDLEVLGSSTIIESVVQDSDHWVISPKNGAQTALKIEPDLGVTPIVDLITVRRTFGTTPVFRVDKNGNLIATQNFTLGGLLNGVDVAALKNDFDAHIAGSAPLRHKAADIDILPITSLPGASNVQEALEALNTKVDAESSGLAKGYEHVQLTPQMSWMINHPLSSTRAQVTVYDASWEQIIPESVKIIDSSTILITFVAATVGRAMILAF